MAHPRAALLEGGGFRVAILSQPDWHSCEAWRQFGRPRLFFAVSAGNMDSMINHYTANKKVRNDDAYCPGGRIGLRPDRATLGLLPARPRGVPGRAGHRRRRRGVAAAAGPLRLLERHGPPLDPARLPRPTSSVYGMGERPIVEIARRLAAGADGARPARPARRGVSLQGANLTTQRACERQRVPRLPTAAANNRHVLPSYEEVAGDKPDQVRLLRHDQDRPSTKPTRYNAKTLVQFHDRQAVVVNPPALPLTQAEMDRVYDLPYTRRPHPSYGREPIPAYEMIKDSVHDHARLLRRLHVLLDHGPPGRHHPVALEESVLAEVRTDGAPTPSSRASSATSAARPPTCTRCAARGPRSRRSAGGSPASIRRSASCSAPTTAR